MKYDQFSTLNKIYLIQNRRFSSPPGCSLFSIVASQVEFFMIIGDHTGDHMGDGDGDGKTGRNDDCLKSFSPI